MAIAYRRQVDADTEFAIWKIEEKAEELYEQLQLNEVEAAYVETLSKGKRNLHWLGTRVLLRKMLQTEEYIDCKVDEHGKPYLVNIPYHISLSHSFDYAAVMVSKSKPVGIDIEQINDKIERIAHKFMTEREMADLNSPAAVAQMYVYWCAKEAIYKCYGQKEVSFLENIHLQPFEFAAAGTAGASLHKEPTKIAYEVNYMQYNGYMIGYVKG